MFAKNTVIAHLVRKTLAFLLIAITPFILNAQKGISLSVDYEIPFGQLASIYNPTLSYTISYLDEGNEQSYALSDYRKKYSKNKHGFSWNYSLGYQSFKSKQDTFYYLVNEKDLGFDTYSNFSILSFATGVSYKIPSSDKMNFYPGIDLGYYYIWYKYTSKDPSSDISGSLVQGKGALSTKLGISYQISEFFEIKFQSKFNFLYPVSITNGDQTPVSSSANSGSTFAQDFGPIESFNITWSNGFSLIYSF